MSDATRETGQTASIRAALAAVLVAAACGGDDGAGRDDAARDTAAPATTQGDPATFADPLMQFIGRPWRALGTEPFWGLEVSEEAIVFTEPAAAPLAFPSAEPRAESGAAVLSTERDGRVLQVTVRDTACSDGMSDRRYEYSAHLVLDGESRRGCALPDSTPASAP